MHIKRFFQKLGLYRQQAFYQYRPDENHIELLNFGPPKNTTKYGFTSLSATIFPHISPLRKRFY